MPIPSLPDFESLLGTLTLTAPPSVSSDWEVVEAIPERLQTDHRSGQVAPAVQLWARPQGKLRISGLVEKVRKELGERGYHASRDLAMVLLALFTQVKRDGSNVESLNKLLGTSTRVDCMQYLIAPVPPHPGVNTFEIGRFKVGRLDRQRLVYWCEKVDCDFFERYPKQFSDRLAIERRAVEVLIWDLPAVARTLAPGNILGRLALDYYVDLVTQEMKLAFEQELAQAQEVLVTAGAPFLDVKDPQSWWAGTFVAIYLAKQTPSWGWFCPLGLGLRLDWAQADRRIPQVTKSLKERFAFEGLGTHEFATSVGTFCRFVTRSRAHEAYGRTDEAFLHQVIALDLLFGTRQEITRSVCRRTAVLVAATQNLTFERSLKLVEDVYSKRSRYVHAGEPVGGDDLSRIQPIVNSVFEALMRHHGHPRSREAGFFDDWCKQLDYAAAAFEAGRILDPDDLVGLGAIDANATARAGSSSD
jgi:hypothetical protein